MLLLKKYLESTSSASMPAFKHMPLERPDKDFNTTLVDDVLERLNLLLGRAV